MLIKRILDLILGCLALLIASPFMLVTAILVRTTLGTPIIYVTARGGLGNKIIYIHKFRTMTDARDAKGALLPDEKRLTNMGKFLRRFSLDEFPQFWDVVAGRLSMVGPRPFIAEYLPRYNTRQRKRHCVKPGITGWAQINGRNQISWEEKFELDLWYVENRSTWLDIKILFQTFFRVITGHGISSNDHSTMPVFMGSESNTKGQDENKKT